MSRLVDFFKKKLDVTVMMTIMIKITVMILMSMARVNGHHCKYHIFQTGGFSQTFGK